MRRTLPALLRVLLAIAVAATTAAATATPFIPNGRTPADGLLCGGQPAEDDLATAHAAGYRTVINLRADGESGFAWEPDAVKAAGMDYVAIPVAGAAGLTRENAARLDAALKQASAKGPVIVHCASGNRVGALLALRAAWVQGADPATALALGKASGLAGLESKVRELLGVK